MKKKIRNKWPNLFFKIQFSFRLCLTDERQTKTVKIISLLPFLFTKSFCLQEFQQSVALQAFLDLWCARWNIIWNVQIEGKSSRHNILSFQFVIDSISSETRNVKKLPKDSINNKRLVSVHNKNWFAPRVVKLASLPLIYKQHIFFWTSFKIKGKEKKKVERSWKL